MKALTQTKPTKFWQEKTQLLKQKFDMFGSHKSSISKKTNTTYPDMTTKRIAIFKPKNLNAFIFNCMKNLLSNPMLESGKNVLGQTMGRKHKNECRSIWR